MTNFAFIMDLLKISTKFLTEAGFDHSLISRWRSGNRRLMPGRHQVKTIAAVFMDNGNISDMPVLEMLVNAWYPLAQRGDGLENKLSSHDVANPAASHRTKMETQELLERFLTEKGQTAPEYQKTREARLGHLWHLNLGSKTPVDPRGIGAIRQGLLDFLNLVGTRSETGQIYFVFTEDVAKYPDDEGFRELFMNSLMKLFEKGHKLAVAARSDRAISDGWNIDKIRLRLFAHLNGYMRTQLYDDFRQQGSDKILGMAGDKLAFRVTRESMWDFDNSFIHLYHDCESVAQIGEQIRGYFKRAQPVVYYRHFDEVKRWLSRINIRSDLPCYLFARLPHFCVAPQEEFAERFALSEDERALLLKDFRPLTLDPAFYSENTAVRHVFCETNIENMLCTKRHQAHEMSSMLHRKVWMTTPNLARQLLRLQTLLKTHKNYEVCFLSDEYFSVFLPQIVLWGNQAVISWLEGKPAMVSAHHTTVTAMQSYCNSLWEEIPLTLRSRSLAARKLNQWIKRM